MKTPKDYIKEYQLDPKAMPSHIAMIMDGNGRWAKQQGKSRSEGHRAGRMALKLTLKNCVKLGVKYLTVYAFSTENWNRPKTEVSFLMNFFKTVVNEELESLKSEGVKIRFLGDLQELPKGLQEKIKKAEQDTDHFDRIQLNIMINYGSRREITQAVEKLIATKKEAKITESDIESALYTAGMPDPEILVRTGGRDNMRISNYMLWQIAYTELFFLEELWPDFDMDALVKVLKQYQGVERRFGGLVTKTA